MRLDASSLEGTDRFPKQKTTGRIQITERVHGRRSENFESRREVFRRLLREMWVKNLWSEDLITIYLKRLNQPWVSSVWFVWSNRMCRCSTSSHFREIVRCPANGSDLISTQRRMISTAGARAQPSSTMTMNLKSLQFGTNRSFHRSDFYNIVLGFTSYACTLHGDSVTKITPARTWLC